MNVDEYIVSKGYKEFKPTSFNNNSVIRCFQKRFDDENGKKYFITVNKWDWTWVNDAYTPPYSYEFDIQLYQKETHAPININFFSGWNLDDVEEYMEKIWNLNIFDYYEEWNE